MRTQNKLNTENIHNFEPLAQVSYLIDDVHL